MAGGPPRVRMVVDEEGLNETVVCGASRLIKASEYVNGEPM